MSPEIRQSKSLTVRVDQVVKRREEYRSDLRIPSQSVWGYITRRTGPSVFEEELPLRFSSQIWTIWDVISQPILRALCIGHNAIYADIINELAKKVQIPVALPPTLVVQPKFSVTSVLGLNRPTSLSFTSIYETDFDVTLFYDDLSPTLDGCTSITLPPPQLPPIEDVLPSPGGTAAEPAPPEVPPIPPGSPPIGGSSLIPGDSLPGDNPPPQVNFNTLVKITIPGYLDPQNSGCSLELAGAVDDVYPGIIPASEFQLVDTTPSGLPPQGCPGVAVYKRVQVFRNGVPQSALVAGVAEMTQTPFLSVTYIPAAP